MSIPTGQLDNWSKTGADKSGEETTNRIENALKDSDLHENKDFRVFRQGSYKNSTHIYKESDVDVVVRLEESWISDKEKLEDEEVQKYDKDHSKVDYNWEDFRNDVLSILKETYGSSSLEEGSKAIKIETESLPKDADVVITTSFRKYYSYSDGEEDYIPGIVFWEGGSKDGDRIVNFPREHYKNGTKKSDNTKKRFKETVRIFKNASAYMSDKGVIEGGIAPSYFIECLIYRVPDDKFKHDKQDRFTEILSYLEEKEIENFVCQNGVQNLFGPENTQWDEQKAREFIEGLRKLWEDWYEVK